MESSYHSDAGRRYLRTKETIGDEKSRFARSLLAVILEPLRYLTYTFLRHGHAKPNYNTVPPIVDLVSKARSSVIWVLQYYSMLLAGEGSRLKLLYCRGGHGSLGSWPRQHPDQARLFRRSVLLAVAHVQRHHHDMYFAWPWRLFSLADPRVAESEHRSLVQEFKAVTPCCLPHGFGRELIKQSEEMLLGSFWRTFLFLAGWVLRSSVAPVETLHSRSRRRADHMMGWTTFVANFVSEDCMQKIGGGCWCGAVLVLAVA